jgi:hypothetical protein
VHSETQVAVLCSDQNYYSYDFTIDGSGYPTFVFNNNTHLAMNSQYVAAFSPLRTGTGGTYLHDGNLHEFPKLAMGYANPAKTNTYGAGLVPEGAAHTAEGPHYFLGKNGLWGLPSEHTNFVGGLLAGQRKKHSQ